MVREAAPMRNTPAMTQGVVFWGHSCLPDVSSRGRAHLGSPGRPCQPPTGGGGCSCIAADEEVSSLRINEEDVPSHCQLGPSKDVVPANGSRSALGEWSCKSPMQSHGALRGHPMRSHQRGSGTVHPRCRELVTASQPAFREHPDMSDSDNLALQPILVIYRS
jgi:hypothetical protein